MSTEHGMAFAQAAPDARHEAVISLLIEAARQNGHQPDRQQGITHADDIGLSRATIAARTALEDVAAAAASAAAQARSLADALDETLALLEAEGTPLRSAEAPAPAQVDALSPRELEVLALVTEGHSNRAIAEALYVSPNTVKTHVASLLHKLRASSRAQLAAMATRQEQALQASRRAGIEATAG